MMSPVAFVDIPISPSTGMRDPRYSLAKVVPAVFVELSSPTRRSQMVCLSIGSAPQWSDRRGCRLSHLLPPARLQHPSAELRAPITNAISESSCVHHTNAYSAHIYIIHLCSTSV